MPSQTAPDDATVCAGITRQHARTFALASRLLPPEKRRAAYALYAFCRVADDLVDQASSGDPAVLSAQLGRYRGDLLNALEGRPSGPIFRELARVSTEYGVSADPLFELLDGVGRDITGLTCETWADLQAYCEGVASSVGEMCTYVFGVPGDAATQRLAIRHARTLGIAMQLTNILRDVGEDAARGRVYLPTDELQRYGLTANDILHASPALVRSSAWQQFMAFQIARARALYAEATHGIALLTPDAQRCAVACATGYAAILDAIEAQGYDTVSRRARARPVTCAAILWRAWRHRAPQVAPPVRACSGHDTHVRLA